MTIPEIEAHLAKHYPDHQFVVSEKLGIGLPMPDGVLVYAHQHGGIDQIATYLINMTKGLYAG